MTRALAFRQCGRAGQSPSAGPADEFVCSCSKCVFFFCVLLLSSLQKCNVYSVDLSFCLFVFLDFFYLSLIFFLQETHQQLADRTGLNVVELRSECGMRPVIVASPREGAQNKILKKRSDKAEYDLNEVFDPYRGLHRPKKVQDLF